MKAFFLVLIFPLYMQFVFPLHARPFQEIHLKSESAILINAETGVVLFEKNSRAKLPPASLTKIATALYTLKQRDGEKLEKIVAAEQDAIGSVTDEEMRRSQYTLPPYRITVGASHIGIKRGEELTLRDLLYGMMVASADDASNVIASYIGGSIPAFMGELNRYLKELGCKDTVLKNPHGLHHPDHVSTACDVALMTQEALKNSTFREIVKSVCYKRPDTNKQKSTVFAQTNRLLRKGKFYYPKSIGVKTGYTSHAQHNLVAAAIEGDRTLIAVLMKCSQREALFQDAIDLFKKASAEKKVKRTLLLAGPQKTVLAIAGGKKEIKTYLKEDVVIECYPSEEPEMRCLLQWDNISLPIEKDHPVGHLSFVDSNGRTWLQKPLLAVESVGYSLWHRVKERLTPKTMLVSGIILFLLFSFAVWVKSRP